MKENNGGEPPGGDGSPGSGPVYAYHPGRPLLIMGVFAAAAAAAACLLYRSTPAASLMLGLVTAALLYQMTKECSVSIWLDRPNLVYSYRSLFRSIHETIPSWEIEGLTPEIVSMWRGNITERLVLETAGGKLTVAPVYSRSDTSVLRLEEVLRTLPSTREEAEYEAELERRALEGDDGEEEEATETVEVWGFIEMGIQCPRCDGPVVVNGPLTGLVCPECGAAIDMTPDIWADLLEDLRDELAEDTEEGMGGRSTIWGTYNTTLYYGRLRPYCRGCKKDFDMEKDRRGTDRLVCSACGAWMPVIEPPVWWDRVFEGATLIVGADTGPMGKVPAVDAPVPVSFTCPKCGASVTTAGESRTIECPHCGASFALPDDLWYHFHPAPVKKRWFTGFTAEVPVQED
jgi:uncharacterized protein YbaR (Trm112 family)